MKSNSVKFFVYQFCNLKEYKGKSKIFSVLDQEHCSEDDAAMKA
jgi:hypothetical protein